jgi:AraC family transcriptional regulator of adaptative response / DNA-3-methyladenine glycosylase II
VRGAPPESLYHLSATARRVFDLAADPLRIAGAFQADPLLGPLVKERPGLRIPGVWDPFECAVRAVLGQQVSVASARTLAARLVQRAGRTVGRGAHGLTHVFPGAAAIAEADLEGIGLAGARIATLRGLARAVAEERIHLGDPAGEVTAAIAALPGCGPWTAPYVALRGFGDPDAFPASDLVLRRTAGAPGPPLAESALAARAQGWRPWRGYAALHVWQHAADRQHLSVRLKAG